MSATANSANTIHLSHNITESGGYYNCVMRVRGDEKRAVTIKEAMSVTGLLPDTTYRVDCVGYRSDGVEACLEANTTVTTRELHLNLSLLIGTVSSLHKVCLLQGLTECRMSQSEAAEYNP